MLGFGHLQVPMEVGENRETMEPWSGVRRLGKKNLADDAVTTLMYQEMPEPFVTSSRKNISNHAVMIDLERCVEIYPTLLLKWGAVKHHGHFDLLKIHNTVDEKMKDLQSKDFPMLKSWAACVTSEGILMKSSVILSPFLLGTPLKYTHITPTRSFPICVTHIQYLLPEEKCQLQQANSKFSHSLPLLPV